MDRTLRILISDPDSAAREQLAKILTEMGHDIVGFAESADDLGEKGAILRPEMIVAAVSPHDPEDVDVICRLVEKDPIPVVFIAGDDDRSLVDRAASADCAMAFLAKPIKPVDLAAAVSIAARKFHERQVHGRRELLHRSLRFESLNLMAYNIAHDFNNHLTAILGNLELGREQTPSGSPIAGHLSEASKAATRAAELAHQLLLVSGRSQIAAEPIQLSKFIEKQQASLSNAVEDPIQFEAALDEHLPLIEGDPDQIRQLLLALVANAVESHHGAAGRVWIRTHVLQSAAPDAIFLASQEPPAGGPFVVLEVADDGSGMDEEVKSRIFAPFFSTKFSGRGMGLACALGITKCHHGAVEVLSEEGKGTIVRVYFPLAVKPTRTLPPEGQGFTPERSAATVLIADDEPSVLKVAATFLKREGFNVLCAADGYEAVEIFREHADEISVVLLDMTMPRMSGDEACFEILYMRPEARVLLCSGYSEDQLYNRVVCAGMAGFIQKPYDRHSLIDKVREAMHAVASSASAAGK